MVSNLKLLADHWTLAALECGVFLVGTVSAGVVIRYRLKFFMSFPLWLTDKMLAFLSRRPGFGTIFLLIFLFNSTAIFVYMMTGAFISLLPTAISFLTGMNIGIITGSMPRSVMKRRPAYQAASTGEPADADEPKGVNDGAPQAGQGPERDGNRKDRRGLYFPPPEPHRAGRRASGEHRTSTPEGKPPVAVRGIVESVCFVVVAALELPVFWFSLAMGSTMASASSGAGIIPEPAAIPARMAAYLTICVPALAVSAAVETVGIRQSLKKGGLPIVSRHI